MARLPDPNYFRSFQQVDEGHSSFGFKGPGDGVQVVTADGGMAYAGSVRRSYSATLEREGDKFKIKSFSF